MPSVRFLQGNEACAEGAIAAGCRFFAGYPITPANEISEYMARRLPEVGGIFIQMEDEIASIGAVIGASWAGAKAMTATSGPGFSLMQEGIGYAFMTETPCVIVDVQRLGPSTGQATKCGQGDVMQSRWGTHGDYASIVLSPNSVEEMFTLTVRAFNLSEEYRTPVIVLADETTAHLRETARIPTPEEIKVVDRRRPKPGDAMFFGGADVPPMPRVGDGFNVAVTGSTHNEAGIRFTRDPEVHRRLVTRLVGKIRRNSEKIADYEAYGVDECDVGFVSYGCTSRSVQECVEMAREKGLRVGHIRLRTLWPLPEKPIRELAEACEVVFVPELNLGQLVLEVERVAGGDARVVPVNKVGGGEMITPEELLSEVLGVVRGA